MRRKILVGHVFGQMKVVDRDQPAMFDALFQQFLLDNYPVDPFDILRLKCLILHRQAKQEK